MLCDKGVDLINLARDGELDAIPVRELMHQLMIEEKKGTPIRLYAEQAIWKIDAPERQEMAMKQAREDLLATMSGRVGS